MNYLYGMLAVGATLIAAAVMLFVFVAIVLLMSKLMRLFFDRTRFGAWLWK